MRDGRDADSRKSQTSFLAVFSFSYGRKPGFSYGKTACKAHAVLVCHRFNEERHRKVHTMGISRNRLVPGLVGLAASAAIVLPLGIGMPVSSATAEENAPVQTLNVDYGTTTGDFYGGSSGMLYGLGDEGSPTDAILDLSLIHI